MSTPESEIATPFPVEERGERDTDQPAWNPWGKPPPPGFFTGTFYSDDYKLATLPTRLAAMPGSAMAKGEEVLGGVLSDFGSTGNPGPVDVELGQLGERIAQDARARLKDLRPDPQTTGAAIQSLHALGSGLSTAVVGTALGGPAGAFGALSTTEGYDQYRTLLEQGVDPQTATKLALTRGALAGAGAVTPMAFGAGLFTRLATGAASNVAYGVADRSIDSAILRHAGYDDMADQEEVFDRTQLLTDLALGAGFGGWAHIHARMSGEDLAHTMSLDSSNVDAALVTNLALRDRASSPGVPISPAAAAAHSRALEGAVRALQDEQHVNVAGSGIEEASVLSRGGEPNPEVADIFARAVQDSGLLEEQAKLSQLEEALGRKITGEPEPQESGVTHRIIDEGEPSERHMVESPNGYTEAIRRGDTLQVLNTETAEAGQGRGEGTERMERLVEEAYKRGLTVTSDTKVSEAATKVYDRLERAGYEVTRNPAEPDGEGSLVATAGRPIFEVRPKPVDLEHRLATDEGLRAGLTAMKGETGWAEVGGRLLMDSEGKVLGRTKWIPREQWWAERPKGLTEDQVHAAVDKALAGSKLTKRQRSVVSFMADVHEERVQRAGTLAELQNAVPDLHEQPAPAVDLTVLASRASEFNREATVGVLDSWADDEPATLARVQDELERIIGRGHETPPAEPAEPLKLEAPPAGREQPTKAQRAARELDLFGEDRSREQQLADESRRRDLIRSPGGHVSLETGRPDDLFSQSVRQVDLADQARPFAQELPQGAQLAETETPTKPGEKEEAAESGVADRLAMQALEQRPGLKIPDADGTEVPAAAAKASADEEAARTEKSAPSLFQKLGDCFLRNGS